MHVSENEKGAVAEGVQAMPVPAAVQGPVPLLLKAVEVAGFLRVSAATFWKLHSMGKLPLPVRIGARVVRWRREELESWVKAGCPNREKWNSDKWA